MGRWHPQTSLTWDRSETVETLSLNLPGVTGQFKNLRIPLTALSSKQVCPHTWRDIMSVIKWSLEVLATGHWPTQRHDGTPWRKSDSHRRAPRPIQMSCLVEVRADWEWMAKVYGMLPHNLAASCCWKCICTPAQVSPTSEHKHAPHLSGGISSSWIGGSPPNLSL